MTAEDENTLLIHRSFDAPAADVFDAWLVRERWQSWIGPEGIACQIVWFEPHVGGRYRLEMDLGAGTLMKVAGVFEIIERPRLLRFTWGAEGDPLRQSTITLTFSEQSGRTEMILRQENLGTVASRESHRNGWESALRKLQRYLEEGS